MDSDKSYDQQQTAEVRNRRLLFFGAESMTGETDAEQEPSVVGAPVASSTLLSDHQFLQPHPRPGPSTSNSAASAAPSTSSSAPVPLPNTLPTLTSVLATANEGDIETGTTAIVVFNGRSAQELLRSIGHLLSQQNLASARGSPQHQDVVAAASGAERSLASSSAPSTSTGARPRVPLSRRKHKPTTGSSECGHGKFQGVSSDSSDCDDIEKQKPDTRRFNFKKPFIQHNWRELLPNTSSAGFGDENKPSTSAPKKRPGRPKGSKNKQKLNESSYSGEDYPHVLQVSNTDSSDCSNSEAQSQPPMKRFQSKPLAQQRNWRESLPSTSSGAGCGSAKKTASKRGPGRPKGSKNKSKLFTTCAAETTGLSCHICREGREGGAFCITDCGHLFHKKCLDRWIATSSQKYRTHKTCPYCGGNFQTSIPFFG